MIISNEVGLLHSFFFLFSFRVKECLPSCYEKEKSALSAAVQVRMGWDSGAVRGDPCQSVF